MLIIAEKVGQLGNRLLLYSNVIAYAIEHNLTVVNPSFAEYASLFETTHQDLLCRYPANRFFLGNNFLLKKIVYRLINYLAGVINKFKIQSILVIKLLDNEEMQLDSSDFQDLTKERKIVFLQGWKFQSSSSLAKHGEKVRAFFTPIEPHRSQINLLISQIRYSCDILCGVHIRQGDYVSFSGGKWFYNTAQYIQVMKSVEQLFPDKTVGFLICSNIAQEKEVFSEFNSFFANNHIIEDMYSLAECDYIIGPPSTYTMWASFYGEVPLYMVDNPSLKPVLSDFKFY